MINFRQCHCNVCHEGMSCRNMVGNDEECGHGVCKTDPNTRCGKMQAAGIKIGCPQ